MKTAIWVVVYFTMCFLLFTGWIFAFAQYAPYNGQEHAFSLTYLLNLFFLHVVMVPYYEFFQTEIYSNVLMSLADESGQMIRFHHVGNDSNLLIVFYVQIMPDDFVMQLHRF